MLLRITDGSVSLGGETVLSHFDFEIRGNEKTAVIGRNGAGKTTLLRVLAGELPLDRDDKNRQPGIFTDRELTVRMLRQDPLADVRTTAGEWIEMVVRGEDAETDDTETVLPKSRSAVPPENAEAMGDRTAAALTDRDHYRLQAEFLSILTGLGFDKEDLEKPVSEFSGGWRTRLALAELMFRKPDILLLDEPTNHLDADAAEWLEHYLAGYPKAVVMVSHDRFFMDAAAESVHEITGKKLVRYPGNYTAYLHEKRRRYQADSRAWRRQQQEVDRLNGLIEKFRTKPRKAAFARSRKKILERMERMEKPDDGGRTVKPGRTEPVSPGPKCVFDIKELLTGYVVQENDAAARTVPLKRITMRIDRGAKLGIFGPNGGGKSTFVKTLAGKIPKLSGRLVMGEGVTYAYFDQFAADVTSEKRVLELFRERFPAYTEQEARSVLAGYLFSGKDAGKRISDLSGGERARFNLMLLLESGPNLLILDEPTNHLDIPSKEIFEDMLAAYKGTVIFVTHDRYFLKKCAGALLYFPQGDGPARYFPYDYEHYVRRREKGARGEDLSVRRQMIEDAMRSALAAVPKKERHEIPLRSDAEAHRDWQLGLLEEELAAAAARVEDIYARYDPDGIPQEWLAPDARQAMREELREAEAAFRKRA